MNSTLNSLSFEMIWKDSSFSWWQFYKEPSCTKLGSQKDKTSVELWWSNNAREALYWSWVWASPVELWYWCKSCCSDARDRDASMCDDERGLVLLPRAGFGCTCLLLLCLLFLLWHARMASRKMYWQLSLKSANFFFYFLFVLGEAQMADPTWQAVGTPKSQAHWQRTHNSFTCTPLGLISGSFTRSQGPRMGCNGEPSPQGWRVQFCYTPYPSPTGRTCSRR